MKRVSIFLMALFAMITIKAEVVKGYESAPEGNILSARVDSVDFRQDLTRVYVTLQGRPHTSSRIDAVILTSGAGTFGASDIDGVDFNRYFQWEDEGEIPVEIDFPATSPVNRLSLTFTTPRGKSIINANRHTK